MDLQTAYNKKRELIAKRLKNFKCVEDQDRFYELCFCLLTPQSKGRKADRAVQELKSKNFKSNPFHAASLLRRYIRFHHTKAARLLEAQQNYKAWFNELDSLPTAEEKRLYLLQNVKGFGLKEASHFLRNTGHENLAILDRHILKNLQTLKVIDEVPKTLTSKKYFEIEEKFINYSKKIKIPMDHLDLLFWSLETGEVFK